MESLGPFSLQMFSALQTDLLLEFGRGCLGYVVEPLPILGDNTTSLPLTHPLEDYPYTPPYAPPNISPMTKTCIGITNYLIPIRGFFPDSLLQFTQVLLPHHYPSLQDQSTVYWYRNYRSPLQVGRIIPTLARGVLKLCCEDRCEGIYRLPTLENYDVTKQEGLTTGCVSKSSLQ